MDDHTTAGDLVESGRCDGKCLVAPSPAKGCTCTCRGAWHGIFSEAPVDAEQDDRLRPTVRPLRHPASGDVVPVVFLRERRAYGSQSWVFDCPWCGDWHSHGDTEGRWGLRVSHCRTFQGSYVILPESSIWKVWPHDEGACDR